MDIKPNWDYTAIRRESGSIKLQKGQHSFESADTASASSYPDDACTTITELTERRPSSSRDITIASLDCLEKLDTLSHSLNIVPDFPLDFEPTTPDPPICEEDSSKPSKLTRSNTTNSSGRELRCLQNTSRLLIRHDVELHQVHMGCEKINKFRIYKENQNSKQNGGSQGPLIISGEEETGFCTRLCLRPSLRPPFDIVLVDWAGKPVISLSRNECSADFSCCCCCFPCCLQSMDVYGGDASHPTDFYLGRVQQRFAWGWAKFEILDSQGETVGWLRGKQFFSSAYFCRDLEFDILAPVSRGMRRRGNYCGQESGMVMGKIVRKWSGFFSTSSFREDGNNFELSFDGGLETKMKTLLIATCVLLNLVYFENSAPPIQVQDPPRLKKGKP